MEMLAIFCVLRCTRVISNVNMYCGVVASRKKVLEHDDKQGQ